MSCGRPPDLGRRHQISELRAVGLSLAEIARKLGISKQRVQLVLKFSASTCLVPIHCQECGTVIAQLHGVADNNRGAWCRTCLAQHPQATFGQRLKNHRLALGLTLTALERQSGVDLSSISAYECGRSEPKW
jgi:DNA-binding transcriptional regulator YiaG